MSSIPISESDLAVVTPGSEDYVRGVTALGASRRFRIGGPTGLATNEEMTAAVAAANAAVQQVMTTNPSPKFRPYGGQVAALVGALVDPLHQAVYVTMVGDSITWGATLPENATSEPRNGTLADPRDNYTAPSYVNEFKRYIGRTYFDNVTPTLSNWSYSTAGQSTAQFVKNINLYPNLPPFSLVASGGSLTLTEPVDAAYLLGKALRMDCASASSYHEITIPNFTGDAISVVYTAIVGLMQSYELYVDGVLTETFNTEIGSTSNGNVKNHAFTYVRNKTLKIRSKYPVGGVGTKRLILEAIRIPKTCRITNQGVIGTEFRRYADWNFGLFGPSVTSAHDEFYFVQLGTNNRAAAETPYSVNRLKEIAIDLIDLLEAAGNVILMVANPASPDYPTSPFKFGMSDVRSTLNDVAKGMSLDFIDNFAAFQGLTPDEFTADGLHPDQFGHSMIVKNIIGAMELS